MTEISNFNFVDAKRAFIALNGADNYSFLNGLVTNDITTQKTLNRIIYACLLTAQGKYECDFFVFQSGDNLIIDCMQAHLPILMQKFKIYKLRADVVITDVSSHWTVQLSSHDLSGSFSVKDPRHPDLGYRNYRKDHPVLIQLASTYDIQKYYNHLRISLGIPSYPASLIPNKTTPLEANMDELNAIAWDKGCYLGQELTARTKYRGMINKRYLPVYLDSGTPEIGWEIQYNNEKIGKLLEFDQAIGIARLSIDTALQVIKRGHTISQKYCTLKPAVPNWLKLI